MAAPSGSNSPNLEDLLRIGINSAKAGNPENARVIFQQVLDIDKRNERAWLWMASVAENDIDKRRFLETVLKLNPNNQTARKLLNSMDQAIASSESESMMLGVRILLAIFVLLLVVGIIVFVVTR